MAPATSGRDAAAACADGYWLHFGRVKSLQGIDFRLPADAPRTQAFFNLAWSGPGRLHAGCPIWNDKSWIGSLYPKGTKSADFLAVYARQVRCVEVNSTFYYLLDAPRIDAWRRQVTSDFKFCPKVYRGISENLGDARLKELIATCAEGFAAFGDNYGLGFVQFPETFSPEYGGLLKRFLELWPRSLPLAVEVRHRGWFKQHVLLDDLINLLYRHGAATVITDTPGRRDVLHTSLSQPRVMVRFQGNEGDPTDETRLVAWAERLIDWADKGMEDLYLFCHQPTETLIPQTLGLYVAALAKQLNGRSGHSERKHPPTLAVSATDGQGSLFTTSH